MCIYIRYIYMCVYIYTYVYIYICQWLIHLRFLGCIPSRQGPDLHRSWGSREIYGGLERSWAPWWQFSEALRVEAGGGAFEGLDLVHHYFKCICMCIHIYLYLHFNFSTLISLFQFLYIYFFLYLYFYLYFYLCLYLYLCLFIYLPLSLYMSINAHLNAGKIT